MRFILSRHTATVEKTGCRARFRFEFSHEFQTRAHSHRHDRSNVRQNVPEASQAIWFGSRLADERKSFAAVRPAHAALIYRLANRIHARVLRHVAQNAQYFPRATNPRVFFARRVIRVIPVAFRERKSSFGTIQSTSSRAVQLEVPRGMDHDKGQALRGAGEERAFNSRSTILDTGG